jgi:pyruvate dehydrogenase phosphatase
MDGSPEKTLRFLVLATDGLWDQLRYITCSTSFHQSYSFMLNEPNSSEDVVSLVGGHLAGLKGTIPKSDLPSLVPTSAGSLGIEGKDKKNKATAGSWAFADDNVSAHLIRNAFGGGDKMALRRILSIPAPYARRYRDDITVTVVWWEDGNEEGAQISSFTDKVKSKL